ncbi:MAG: PepSY domain-containing protein [Burkholderiales bacterium]
MNRKLFLIRILRRWHARIGVAAVVFLVFLATTGLALNHGTMLGLDGVRVHAAWLSAWYGIRNNPPGGAFDAGGSELVWGNSIWLLNRKVIAEQVPAPLGMVEAAGILYIASGVGVSMYFPDGRLVDTVAAEALSGGGISAIGSGNEGVALRAGKGNFCSTDGIAWKPCTGQVRWSDMRALSGAEQRALSARLSPGIAAQTILSDVHSGRILGRYGPLVMDAAALILLALGLSGLWVYFRVPHRR